MGSSSIPRPVLQGPGAIESAPFGSKGSGHFPGWRHLRLPPLYRPLRYKSRCRCCKKHHFHQTGNNPADHSPVRHSRYCAPDPMHPGHSPPDKEENRCRLWPQPRSPDPNKRCFHRSPSSQFSEGLRPGNNSSSHLHSGTSRPHAATGHKGKDPFPAPPLRLHRHRICRFHPPWCSSP